MPRRPFYVTLVGIYLIFFGLEAVWFVYAMCKKAGSEGVVLEVFATAPVTSLLVLAYAVAELASGIGVFRGANWARWLWSIWWVLMLIYNMAVGNTKDVTVPSVLLEAVTTVLLFLPGANAFFDPESRRSQQPGASGGR